MNNYNDMNMSQIPNTFNSNNIKNNRTKNLFIIIGSVALVVVAVALVIALAGDKKDNKENKSSNGSEEINTPTGKRIGSKEYGYVTVPNDWVKFYDLNATDSNMVQYSYETTWIVTLYAIDTDSADAKNYAYAVANNVSEDGASDVNIVETKIGEDDAYQVSCHYVEENVWLYTWFVELDDGRTHYIAIEGPNATSDYYDIVNTFSLTE